MYDEDVLLLSHFLQQTGPFGIVQKLGVAVVRFPLPLMHLLGLLNFEAVRPSLHPPPES